MTSVAASGTPSEQEIRRLVGRIVDGLAIENQGESSVAEQSEIGEAPGPGGPMRIAIGADHGGYPLKEKLLFKLRESGYEVVDRGTHSHESVDYPDFAHAVAREVATGSCLLGIIVDGAGIGSAMVANKVPGVRAAPCYDLSSARNSREHNHANVLTLGAGLIGDGLAWQIVEEWLSVEWGGGRHARRVAKIDAVEQQYSRSE